MAACGTQLRAPARGTVRLVDEEGSAGRYVVLRTASGAEVVLMHLQDVDVTGGERVTTGEGVGTVGRTGNASACHLHIERWSAPGWYAGGTPLDPSAMLRLEERSDAGRVP
jgi:murein DD-endopeptidase MepM/ murein hydrolase activator NlpD